MTRPEVIVARGWEFGGGPLLVPFREFLDADAQERAEIERERLQARSNTKQPVRRRS